MAKFWFVMALAVGTWLFTWGVFYFSFPKMPPEGPRETQSLRCILAHMYGNYPETHIACFPED